MVYSTLGLVEALFSYHTNRDHETNNSKTNNSSENGSLTDMGTCRDTFLLLKSFTKDICLRKLLLNPFIG